MTYVIIIEDDRTIAEGLTAMIARSLHDVTVKRFDNLTASVSALTELEPICVIYGVENPDGFVTIRNAAPDVPIVALLSRDDERGMLMAMRYAALLLEKPFDTPRVAAFVQHLFEVGPAPLEQLRYPTSPTQWSRLLFKLASQKKSVRDTVQIIEEDFGLALGVLRIAAALGPISSSVYPTIDSLVKQIGLERLEKLVVCADAVESFGVGADPGEHEQVAFRAIATGRLTRHYLQDHMGAQSGFATGLLSRIDTIIDGPKSFEILRLLGAPCAWSERVEGLNYIHEWRDPIVAALVAATRRASFGRGSQGVPSDIGRIDDRRRASVVHRLSHKAA